MEVKRPIDYDENLKPSTDVNTERFGFPSIESYMSVVVLGHWWLQSLSLTFLALATILCFIIGTTRVMARSRFPHQIIGSWLLGFFGLITGAFICDSLQFHR